MTDSLRFPGASYQEMSNAALADVERESCAVAFTVFDDRNGIWLVQDHEQAPDASYELRNETAAVLKPSYVVDLANRARAKRQGVVIAHTHPFSRDYPAFSSVDNQGETALAEYFSRRAPFGQHLALVIGAKGCRARRLGTRREVSVWEVGERLRLYSPVQGGAPSEEHDRQVRAFGAEGQKSISALRVGIVGLGGTGSIVLQELAHLGVRDFLLIVPDVVDRTNLNRLVGATLSDEGSAKVRIAEARAREINPTAQISSIQRDVVDADVAMRLLDRDVIFLCTDSHASRAVVGQLAYQYLIPAIDMGVSITVRGGAVTHITGRVQLLSPGEPCLTCTAALDGEQIRREMLTPEQRAADPYVLGAHEPQPAVISLNGTVSSLAVTMFLGLVTEVPANARFQLYDGIRGTVRPTTARRVPNSIVCSLSGSMAKGPNWPLPVRPSELAGD
jgi:molybdopterin/thiamine biosynthesis adenylyltransferase